ncbi:MAG: hypothetical protein PQJ60_14495, partial [Spirochaetales bacterium]|nr:hypothetical protein [Spirochaetales bacterium]
MRALLASLLIYFTLLSVMFIPLKESGTALEDNWLLTMEGEAPERVSFPYYKKLDGNRSAVFSTVPEATSYKTLALLWPSVTSLEVRFNGQTVHMVGDPQNPSANIWNYFHIIELPEAPDGTDTLSFHVTGFYDFNLRRIPYLESRSVVTSRAMIHNFIYNTLLLIFMGAAIITGIYLFIMPAQDQRFARTARLLGVTALLLCLYCLNFCHTPAMGGLGGFVLAKRLFLAGGFGATLCFCFSLENYYAGSVRVTKYLAPPTFLALALILFIPDFSFVWHIVPYLNLILLINLVTSIYLCFKGKRNSDQLLISPFLVFLTLG